MIENFSSFYKKYQGEFKISLLALVFSSIVSIITTALFTNLNTNTVLLISFSSIFIILLFSILINLKRFLTRLMLNTKYQLIEASDLFYASKYQERSGHFSGEKKFLADKFVQDVLPNLFKKIMNDYQNLKSINLIFDSGTTITPIFNRLILHGLPKCIKNNITTTIFTNNLAGIRELYKVDPNLCSLSERDFNLIGGQPLSNYRATTGPLTEDFLKVIWERQSNNKKEMINVSVITANWFLGGADLRNLQICAKGEGHFRFKKQLIDNSQYIVVISPLGKILRIENVDELYALLPDPKPKDEKNKYKSYPIDGDNKRDGDNIKKSNQIILLTTFRPKQSKSPFANHSLTLKKICTTGFEKNNYKLSEKRYEFEPDGDQWDVVVTELPHTYIRDKFVEAYGYSTELFKHN